MWLDNELGYHSGLLISHSISTLTYLIHVHVPSLSTFLLKVWLDKCCIDQNDIEANLMCLPVFLAGCNRLLVLSGETYLQRLWCVMELMIFLEMGDGVGRPGGRITLRSLWGDTDTADAQLREAYDAFDIRDTTCFLPEDKEQLLGIVEEAFASFDQFNGAVRSMLRTALNTRLAQQRQHENARWKHGRRPVGEGGGGDDDNRKLAAMLEQRLGDLETKMDRILAAIERGWSPAAVEDAAVAGVGKAKTG